MAFGEHFIDFMSGLPSGAGRMAGPERRFELRTFCFLSFQPPADKAFGLARQIIERQLEGI